MRIRPIALALVLLTAVSCHKPLETPDSTPAAQPFTRKTATYDAPKRIVLFIGDGMGIGELTAAAYSNGGPLEILQMPHVGFMTTHEYEFLTTDSAASATAISTGRKTSYEAVAVTPGTTVENQEDPSHHMQTLMELASENGLRTGLVSTSRVNHATEAGFAAHRFHRHRYEQIASDFAKSDLDVVIGPGQKNFIDREDGRDLLAEMASAGWATAKSVDELDAIPPEADRVIALLRPGDYPFMIDDEPREMSLPDMVSRAISLLDRSDPKGWVLMVEGSFVDWCGHNLDGPCAAMEVLDLDQAVGRARTYARGRDDTLVVVTADHETGGMAVIDPYYADRFAKILGGEDAATQLAALPDIDGKPVPAPPPFQHIAIGGRSARLETSPLPNPGLWGMDELADGRASIVMGHFSMASRPFWTQPDRFYGAHSPVMVSIHAEGPGAQTVARTRDNAELGQAIRDLVVAGANAEPREELVPIEAKPRNVILMIGDGMGIPSVTGANYWHGGVRMVDLDVAGLVSTHALDHLVNDSAASASAMATGHRTRKKSVGQMIENGARVAADTILEVADRRGLATGFVTTTTITHATPAAFYAHREDRYDVVGVLDDLISLPERTGDGPEVMFGGGGDEFDASTKQRLTAAGYTLAETWPPTVEGPHLLGMFGPQGLAAASIRMNDDDPSTPTLAEMTRVAIDRVSPDPDGFLLVVEGGQIDWKLHDGVRDASLLAEVVDFDDAVALAADYVAEHPDTLLIVTADHDHTMTLLDNHYAFASGRCGVSTACGGPFEMTPIALDVTGVRNTEGFADRALQGEFAPPQMFLQYAWPVQEAKQRVDVAASHSANFVPLFASGPWAFKFGRFIDQPEIGQILMAWACSSSGPISAKSPGKICDGDPGVL